ncbi:MAG TPA: hypothetical protein PLV68_09775, partial [Ilumatobacteraceae bacterium]|nr:hypothetical protein [Ilumatobacteraceae bacterium]
DAAFDGEQPDFDESEDSPFNPTFAAVERDGRWYISLLYTGAVGAAGIDNVPAREEGIAPVGAKTPEGALDNVIQSLVGLDLESVVAGLNPNEAEVLQRFAPLFIDDMQDELDD